MIPKEPSQREVDGWLNAIFSPINYGHEAAYIDDAILAFENLTYFFIQRTLKSHPRLVAKMTKNIRFDYVGLASMLKRFQMDGQSLHGEVVADRLLRTS